MILQSIMPPQAILLIMFFFDMYQGDLVPEIFIAACKARVKLGIKSKRRVLFASDKAGFIVFDEKNGARLAQTIIKDLF